MSSPGISPAANFVIPVKTGIQGRDASDSGDRPILEVTPNSLLPVRYDLESNFLGMTYERILMVKGPGVRGEGRGDLGVRFDRLNELRGEAGKVLEPAMP